MELTADDHRLLELVGAGLPLVAEPYRAVAAALGQGEDAVRTRLAALIEAGVIARFGVVVRHRALGYVANAMVVWDIADNLVAGVAARLAGEPGVTLCYRRPRRPPLWPYNLFCMIHGHDRGRVLAQIEDMAARLALGDVPRAVLFSRHCYVQRGARYGAARQAATA